MTSFWKNDSIIIPPKKKLQINLKPPTKKNHSKSLFGGQILYGNFMAFSFPSFVFCWVWGESEGFPPTGFDPHTVTPGPRSWGSRNLPLALGSGWSWTPETRWRDVASETWRSYRFFSEGLIRTTDATSQRWGGKGGDGYTVCSHVKKCQICRYFLKGFGEWWNYEIDQMVKCFSSLHCCAFGGHTLRPLLAAAIANWQDAEEGKNDGTVQGERCLLHAICFCFRRPTCFYVSKHAAIMANGRLWWYLKESRYGSEHFILPFTVLVRYFESKPGLD